LGNVRSLNYRRKNIIKNIKPYNAGKGYLSVILVKNKKSKSYKVHRLVAENFLNKKIFKCMPYENKNLMDFDNLYINHKDENRQNNNVQNLEWCSCAYNNCYGNRIKKANSSKSKKIKQYNFNKDFIKEWNSIKEAAETLKISKSGIVNCAKGKFKQFKGYNWVYADLEKENK
jgi:hypothetical protein